MASTIRGGNNRMLQNLMEQYHYALTMSISARCAHLTSLIAHTADKDLKPLYGSLVEEVFGFSRKTDWGLLTLGKNYDIRDFNSLRDFLSPEGPLLKLAYKLLRDQHIYFEFPVSCLPAPSRQSIAQGIVPEFYVKLGCIPEGVSAIPSSNIHLNAFEYFVFHFAYYIVNPVSKYLLHGSKPEDSLYESLLEDFLSYFLPKDSNAIPPYASAFISPTSVSSSPPSSFKSSSASPPSPSKIRFSIPSSTAPLQSTPKQKPSILKLKLLSDSSSNNVTENLYSSHETGTWISELFIGIITEIYLNQYSLEVPQSTFNPFAETFIPNHHHVWIIRVLIKHIHCFSNNPMAYHQGLCFPNVIIDPFNNLRSCLLPKYIQKQFFVFLKMVFQHWPLDASFRAPLETWLSYIQPWRYAPPSPNTEHQSFASRWIKFVIDNLPYYTPFFMQVLLRLFRMDLTCVKNAYMLFRVTKVFSQNDLDAMILEAERTYASGHMKSPHVGWLTSSNPMSFKHTVTSMFQQYFPDSDVSLNNYVPLFSPEVLSQVSRLLTEIVSARERAGSQTYYPMDGHSMGEDKSLFGQVAAWIEEKTSFSESFNLDSQKLDVHLEASANQLCKLFKIDPQSITVPKPRYRNISSPVTSPSASFMDENQNDPNLTFAKRLQLLNNGSLPKVIFQGNPDYQPTRTFEINALVKLFRELSDYFNTKYAEKINELYNRPSILGRISQQIFTPPTVYQEVTKSKDMISVSRKEVCLPPRIVLRSFASKYVLRNYILYLAGMYFIVNWHPFTALLLLLLLTSFLIFFRALFHLSKPKIRQQ